MPVEEVDRRFATRVDLARALDLRRGDGVSPDLLPAGRLGRAGPVPLEALHVLDEIPPHLVPDQLVAEARRTAGVPVACM